MSLVHKTESETESESDAVCSGEEAMALLLRSSPPEDIENTRIKQESAHCDDDLCDKDESNDIVLGFMKQETSEPAENKYTPKDARSQQHDGALLSDCLNGSSSAHSESSQSSTQQVG